MEFLALAIWLLLAGTGAILLPHAVTTPGAGLAALAGLGGLTVCILYIGLDAPNWAGWTQLALTLLGVLGAALTAARVCDDRFTSGSGAEALQATIAGVLLPLYGALVFIAALIATHGTNPVV